MTDELITPAEAARLKGVALPTIYSAVRDGRLPSLRVLGRVGLRREDVEKWEPIGYAGRPGAKGRGGRPPGTPMTDAAKERLAASQRRRWAGRRAVAEPETAPDAYIPWRGFQTNND